MIEKFLPQVLDDLTNSLVSVVNAKLALASDNARRTGEFQPVSTEGVRRAVERGITAAYAQLAARMTQDAVTLYEEANQLESQDFVSADDELRAEILRRQADAHQASANIIRRVTGC